MKVLVIDGCRDVRISLEQVLTESSYLADTVGNGSEGIYHAQY
ncbi:MAG: hypothetical protein AAFX93_16510 [Verrucomicrobiota bacterium]